MYSKYNFSGYFCNTCYHDLSMNPDGSFRNEDAVKIYVVKRRLLRGAG